MEGDSNLPDKNELCQQLDRHLDWIKSCDTKSSIVLAVVGIFLTIFTSEHSVNMLKKILIASSKNLNFSNFLYLLFFLVAWCIFVYGSYCLIRVLVPSLTKDTLEYDGIQSDSLYFFEKISKNKFLEYRSKVFNKTDADQIEDILSQIFINAKICTKKYEYYSRAIKLAFTGIASILLLYVIGVILIKTGGF
jgi:Family of unknown function (DUF5706)